MKILGTVRAADQWAAASDFRRRLLEAFRTNGIEIARPLGELAVADAGRPASGGRRPGRGRPRRRHRLADRPGPNGWPDEVVASRLSRGTMAGRADSNTRSPVSVEQPPPSPEIENLLAESRTFPARPGVRGPGQRDGRPVRGGRGRLRGVLGEARARADRLVDAVHHDARVGPARSPSGSPAASSTSPTTASTGTSSAASATRSPTTGSASRATPGR